MSDFFFFENWTLPMAIAATAILLVFQTVVYYAVEKLEGEPNDIHRPFDDKIPLRPAWGFVYVLWFPLIAIFPVNLFRYDSTVFGADLYAGYMIAIMIDILISVTIYMIYPTTFERPEPPDTFSGYFLKFIYKCSYKGVNCMPSLHCSECFIVILFAAAATAMPWYLRLTALAVAGGIVYSTLATKQHVILDVISAIPLSLICFAGGLVASGLLF